MDGFWWVFDGGGVFFKLILLFCLIESNNAPLPDEDGGTKNKMLVFLY